MVRHLFLIFLGKNRIARMFWICSNNDLCSNHIVNSEFYNKIHLYRGVPIIRDCVQIVILISFGSRSSILGKLELGSFMIPFRIQAPGSERVLTRLRHTCWESQKSENPSSTGRFVTGSGQSSTSIPHFCLEAPTIRITFTKHYCFPSLIPTSILCPFN